MAAMFLQIGVDAGTIPNRKVWTLPYGLLRRTPAIL